MKHIPLPLLLGYLLGAIGSLRAFFLVGETRIERIMEVYALSGGFYTVEVMMVTIGLFELARWANGRARRAMLVAAWTYAVVFALYIGSSCFSQYLNEHVARILELVWFAQGVAFVIAAVALALAARVWERSAPMLSACLLLLIVVIGRAWLPVIGPAVRDLVGASTWYWFALEVAAAITTLHLAYTVGRSTAGAAPDRALGVAGLRLAAKVLWIRIALAGVLALTTLSAFSGGRSKELMTFVLVVAPACVVLTTLCCAWGLCTAARSNVREIPALRLYLAVVAMLWSLGIQVQQLAAAIGQISGERTFGAPAFSMLATVVGFVGLLLVGASVATLGRRLNDSLAEDAAARTIGIALLLLVQVLLPKMSIETRSGATGVLLLSSIAGVIAIWQLAALLHRAAAVLDEPAALPAARVVR